VSVIDDDESVRESLLEQLTNWIPRARPLSSASRFLASDCIDQIR